MKKIAITKEFSDLLIAMGYEENKGTGEYIVGPLEKTSRNGIKAFISNAFTHFFKISGNKTGKTLKHLRKTYSTSVAKKYGEQAYLITGHEGMNVMKDAQKNFSVLGDKMSVHLNQNKEEMKKSKRINREKVYKS